LGTENDLEKHMIDNPYRGHKLFPGLSIRIGPYGYFNLILALFIVAVIGGCAPGSTPAPSTALPPSPVETASIQPTRTASPTELPTATPLPSPSAVPSLEPEAEPTRQLIQSGNVDQLIPVQDLEGHLGPVLAVEYSPDGSLIASGSADKTIRLWNVQDGSMVYELSGHTAEVSDVSFSPDGTILASGSIDGTVRFWSVEGGQLLRTIDSILLGRVLNVEFSPAGNLIAVGGHRCFVELRHTSSGIFFRSVPQPRCVERYNGPVSFWGIDFTSNGQQIVTGEGRACCGGSIQRREVETYTPPTLLEGYQLRVRDLKVSADDSTLVIALVGSPVFWLMDLDDGSLLQTYDGHTFRINSVAISPDGAVIASGSRDRSIGLWDLGGAFLSRLEGHAEAVNSVAFSPLGDTLASAADDASVIVWGIP
jgi:WD40 repeat protein